MLSISINRVFKYAWIHNLAFSPLTGVIGLSKSNRKCTTLLNNLDFFLNSPFLLNTTRNTGRKMKGSLLFSPHWPQIKTKTRS